jgi:hypothetical protein
LEVLFDLALTGALPQVNSPAVSLAVAIVLVDVGRPVLRAGVTVVLIGFLILAPPQTSDALQQDIEMARTLAIPGESVLLHDRTDALPYFIDGYQGKVYRLDGRHTPEINDWVQRDDITSPIVWAAPDYVITDTNPVDAPDVAALDYQNAHDNLYVRRQAVGEFGDVETMTLPFGPEVRINGVADDRDRANPGDVIRLRLDWDLVQPPRQGPLTLNLSVIDYQGQPIATTFPQRNNAVWQTDTLTTYHAIRLPDDAAPGVYDVSISVDYRAALLGQRVVERLVIPFASDAVTTTDTIGDLGSLALRSAPLETSSDDRLVIDFGWRVREPLNEDYQMFVHLTTPDDPTPIRQDDGPPLDGAYPTTFWQPGDAIHDQRSLDLTDLEAGDYLIRVGFFAPDGTRISGPDGDTLIAARLTLRPDGSIEG